ncbi:VOC family protein [Candidatus Hodarchaeum mangrovi]
MKDFYLTLGCVIWLNQGDCIIFQHDNFLFGFCEREDITTGWLLTFFYKTKEEVDEIYGLIKDKAVSQPSYNTKYQIYQFFAKDPEGRDLEFQVFLHKIPFNWDLYQ